MVLTTEIEITAFIGAIIGALIGLLAPYYNKKKELGWNDIDIVFDKAFIKATVVAVILAVIGVGGSFPIILANVPETASILTTLITSAVLALTLHLGGNMIIGPSKITMEARDILLDKNAQRVVMDKLSDLRHTDIETSSKLLETNRKILDATNKWRNANEPIHDRTNSFGEVCDCPCCKDNTEVEKDTT